MHSELLYVVIKTIDESGIMGLHCYTDTTAAENQPDMTRMFALIC